MKICKKIMYVIKLNEGMLPCYISKPELFYWVSLKQYFMIKTVKNAFSVKNRMKSVLSLVYIHKINNHIQKLKLKWSNSDYRFKIFEKKLLE